jgi:hypothetical protein
MRTLFLSILVPVVVLSAWALLFVVLDRISSAESRAATRRAADAAQRDDDQRESDDESGRA